MAALDERGHQSLDDRNADPAQRGCCDQRRAGRDIGPCGAADDDQRDTHRHTSHFTYQAQQPGAGQREQPHHHHWQGGQQAALGVAQAQVLLQGAEQGADGRHDGAQVQADQHGQ
ncbi:hypothetical protein D3C72_2213140 [compost metagenome]